MDNFTKLLQEEVISIVEGLTGQSPQIKLESQESTDTQIEGPMAVILVNADGEKGGKLLLGLPVTLATALSDLMLGGEGAELEEMSEDDLDATKEIVSNIFGSLTTSISAQEEMPKLSFGVDNIKFIPEGKIDLNSFNKLYIFQISIASTTAQMVLAVDSAFISNFQADEDSSSDSPQNQELSLSPEELKNISLLMDINLPVRVRIGTKTVLLKDVLMMDIGSIVELDQLANEPLDILVGNKAIAKGEVVIVDGNFGVQITQIGTPNERLSQLS
ncbi:MAG: flagellar motor switch protein FliY [Sulfurospirillum sp.]|nr:MAG: flagellar motor switch protein FliY [Sulfurospirillum sp.]